MAAARAGRSTHVDYVIMATSYAIESNLPGIFGTDLNQINVQKEIDDTLKLLKSPGLNANDRVNANNYLNTLRQQLGGKYDGGAIQSTVDKYFGGDMQYGPPEPAGDDPSAPYIGTGNRWNRRNVDTVKERQEAAAGGDTLWDKFGGLVGNIGLVIIGIAVTGIALYFTAKKVGDS